MLCVFGRQYKSLEELQSPTKRQKRSTIDPARKSLDEDAVYGQLEALARTLPRRLQAYVTEELLGGGANGIAFVESAQACLVQEQDTSVYFSGELSGDGHGSAEESAKSILHTYKHIVEACCDEMSEESLASSKLGTLKGHYAFIIHDAFAGRIVAARDANGKESMYWGTNGFGEVLMFSSDKETIEDECADVDFFPAGAFFVSNPGDTSGNIGSFRPLDPELSESEVSQGKVPCNASTGDLMSLHKVPSQSAIPTQ